MADFKTLWTVASKSVCGTASPINAAYEYLSLCLSEDAAWADIAQAAFNLHTSYRFKFCVDPRTLSRSDSIGSNFNPYTSSPC